MAFCPACKASVRGYKKFCQNCGKPLPAEWATSPPAEPPPANHGEPANNKASNEADAEYPSAAVTAPVNRAVQTSFSERGGEAGTSPLSAVEGATRAPSESVPSEHGEREGEAPTALPVEGATRAPIVAELFCPTCHAIYSDPAAYCEEDGTPLEQIERYVLAALDDEKAPLPDSVASVAGAISSDGSFSGDRAPPSPATPINAGKLNFSSLRRLIMPALVVLLLFGGGYFYFGGDRGDVAGKQVGAALRTRGFDLTAQVDPKGIATLTGNVRSPAEHEAALTIVNSHKEVKGIIDNIKVVASPQETERALNKALDEAGLTGAQTQVDPEFRVVLSGVVQNERESILAEKTVKANPDVKSVDNVTRVEKGLSSGKDKGESGAFTESRQFALPGLNPSTWASMKFRDTLAFRIPGPGRLTVEANWEPQGVLALILNNAGTGATHAQKDGVSPLRLTYRVTAADYAKGPAWEATIANFSAEGPRKGALKVTFETGVPPERGLITTAKPKRGISDVGKPERGAFDPLKVQKDLNQALRDEGIATVTAEVSKEGVVTLKGSAPTGEAKERALAVTRQFKSIKTVKDIIFVVGS